MFAEELPKTALDDPLLTDCPVLKASAKHSNARQYMGKPIILTNDRIDCG